MTILFKTTDKSLIITAQTKLYQKESAVDAFTFYTPAEYNEYDLSKFTPTLYYLNQANEACMEIMEYVESDKDGFLKMKLPVTSKITKFVGDVTMYLTFTWLDTSTSTSYVLKSGELTVSIMEVHDYFAYVSDASLNAIDDKLLAMDARIQELEALSIDLDKEIPNDLMVTDDLLQLSIDGTPKGDGVHVVTNYDDLDDEHDGEIDLNVVNI